MGGEREVLKRKKNPGKYKLKEAKRERKAERKKYEQNNKQKKKRKKKTVVEIKRIKDVFENEV